MIDKESLEEFKFLCKEYHNKDLTDEEALDAAERVLRFLYATEYAPHHVPQLTDEEKRALDLIKTSCEQGTSATVRSIAAEIGFSSSRSGHKVVKDLIRKSIVSRDESGKLVVLP